MCCPPSAPTCTLSQGQPYTSVAPCPCPASGGSSPTSGSYCYQGTSNATVLMCGQGATPVGVACTVTSGTASAAAAPGGNNPAPGAPQAGLKTQIVPAQPSH
jgi:hypothetical protein